MNLRKGILTRAESHVAASAVKVALFASLCAAAQFVGTPTANAYPDRPIKVIVPLPAGGAADVIARVISERLSSAVGQPVIVDNRAGGAAGAVGAKSVASAEPDGYTMLVTSGGALTNGPAVNRNLGYDPITAFLPVGMLVETPLVISVHPGLPVKSLGEFVDYAKSNPGKLTWGTQGFGSSPHLFSEMLKLQTGINIVQAPYRGTTPLMMAMLAGEIQVMADPMPTSLQNIAAGKLRPLAVAGPQRNRRLPDVPTTAEAGYPKLVAPYWIGALLPAKTPPDIVNTLSNAFRDVLSQPETRTRIEQLGFDIRFSSPDEFAKVISDELAQWKDVVAAANIQVQQ